MSAPTSSDEEHVPYFEAHSDIDDSEIDESQYLTPEGDMDSTLSDAEGFHNLPGLMSVSSSSDDVDILYSDSDTSDDDIQRSAVEDLESVAAFRTTVMDIRRILRGDDSDVPLDQLAQERPADALTRVRDAEDRLAQQSIVVSFRITSMLSQMADLLLVARSSVQARMDTTQPSDDALLSIQMIDHYLGMLLEEVQTLSNPRPAPPPNPIPSNLPPREISHATLMRQINDVLERIEYLDEDLARRLCNVRGGAGEDGESCLICWEPLLLVYDQKLRDPPERSVDGVTSNSESTMLEDEVINPVILLPCQHVMHFDCLVSWLRTRASTCPACRAELMPEREDVTPPDSDHYLTFATIRMVETKRCHRVRSLVEEVQKDSDEELDFPVPSGQIPAPARPPPASAPIRTQTQLEPSTSSREHDDSPLALLRARHQRLLESMDNIIAMTGLSSNESWTRNDPSNVRNAEEAFRWPTERRTEVAEVSDRYEAAPTELNNQRHLPLAPNNITSLLRSYDIADMGFPLSAPQRVAAPSALLRRELEARLLDWDEAHDDIGTFGLSDEGKSRPRVIVEKSLILM
ncbi:SubName: Full=Uncharacterized protein {ECO:0000313/EMBL:CCA72730.1} [Serendipita indica DSM 11827]|nr:SubName: Full=Uncharacterized protein {ECO:0000313/EMBL:CCA72730.1} [Serendipita indica DSM 11827]